MNFNIFSIISVIVSVQLIAHSLSTAETVLIYTGPEFYSQLVRINPDGTDRSIEFTHIGRIRQVRYDPIGDAFYWSNRIGVHRYDRATGQKTMLFTSSAAHTIQGLDIDPASRHVYWLDNNTFYRFSIALGVATPIFSTNPIPLSLELNLVNQRIYWANGLDDNIMSANLDGSDPVEIVGFASNVVTGIEVDPFNEHIYWTDPNNRYIMRADLDGSNPVSLIETGQGELSDLALDLEGGKIYWLETSSDRIRGANLDGTGIYDVETNVSLNGAVFMSLITIVPEPRSIVFFGLCMPLLFFRRRSASQ